MIREDKAAIGSWVSLADPAVVELMALAGYDFALIDMEHSTLDFHIVENMIRTAEGSGITPLVRIGENSENWILNVMESGAHGVVVPHVIDREGARRAVEGVKYQPLGNRGIQAVTRAARWGDANFTDHVRTSNEQTMVIPMVEDREGIDNLEEILSVEGVDLVLLGPADLARSYGVTTEKDPPAVREAVERAAAAARRAGKPLGISIFHSAFNRGYRDLVQLGARFITHGTDGGVLLRAWKDSLKKAKES